MHPNLPFCAKLEGGKRFNQNTGGSNCRKWICAGVTNIHPNATLVCCWNEPEPYDVTGRMGGCCSYVSLTTVIWIKHNDHHERQRKGRIHVSGMHQPKQTEFPPWRHWPALDTVPLSKLLKCFINLLKLGACWLTASANLPHSEVCRFKIVTGSWLDICRYPETRGTHLDRWILALISQSQHWWDYHLGLIVFAPKTSQTNRSP